MVSGAVAVSFEEGGEGVLWRGRGRAVVSLVVVESTSGGGDGLLGLTRVPKSEGSILWGWERTAGMRRAIFEGACVVEGRRWEVVVVRRLVKRPFLSSRRRRFMYPTNGSDAGTRTQGTMSKWLG